MHRGTGGKEGGREGGREGGGREGGREGRQEEVREERGREIKWVYQVWISSAVAAKTLQAFSSSCILPSITWQGVNSNNPRVCKVTQWGTVVSGYYSHFGLLHPLNTANDNHKHKLLNLKVCDSNLLGCWFLRTIGLTGESNLTTQYHDPIRL